MRGAPQHTPVRGVALHDLCVAGPVLDTLLVAYAVGEDGTIIKTNSGGRMTVDFWEQQYCWDAAFRAFWQSKTNPEPLPWFYGFHLWEWRKDHEPLAMEHEVLLNSYTPQQKPAGELIKDWYDWPAYEPQQGQHWVSSYPTGDISVVLDGQYSNVPLLLFELSSASWEKDITGQTPADSARLLQEYLGYSGDEVEGRDSTDWFGFVVDTCWAVSFGQGKYRFKVQYKDAGGEASPEYVEFGREFVYVDTVPPEGTMSINSGDRFTNSTSCVVDVSMGDSVSPVYRMRHGNAHLSNLVFNSWFDNTDGVWEFSAPGGGYDTDVDMAKLDADDQTTSWCRQYINKDSIDAYNGDWVRLSADVLVKVPAADGQNLGTVTFKYWYTSTDPMSQDTSWENKLTLQFQGGMQALVSLDNLEDEYHLEDPTFSPEWEWQGGVIDIEVLSPAGTGQVWLDNVRLDISGDPPQYGWWRAADDTAQCQLEGSASGWKNIWMGFQDSAGCESYFPLVDSIILDLTPPDVSIEAPVQSSHVNGVVELTGWAFDEIEVAGDTWFAWYRLYCRHTDSTEWMPIDPDSVSYEPVYPDPGGPTGPAVKLGDWDTETVENGETWIILVAQDSAGNESIDSIWVVVDNETDDEGGGDAPPGGGGLGGGSVYIGSRYGVIYHLDEDLTLLDTFAIVDSGIQAYITDILVLGDDSVLVADARAQGLRKMGRRGQNRRQMVSNFGLPVGLCRDDNGNIWALDKSGCRFGKFRENGTFVFTKGSLGKDSTHLNYPEAIDVHGEYVYIADTRNNRIAVWDTSGNYLTDITGDFQAPQAIAVTDSGAVYIVDNSEGTVVGLTSLGGRFFTIAADDSLALKYLCLSSDQHHIFSLKPRSNRVVKYRIQSDDSLPGGGPQSGGVVPLPKRHILHQPWPNPSRSRMHIRYGVPNTSPVTVKVYDITGKLARTVATGVQKPGWYDFTWDRTDDRGRTVPAGVYFCQMDAPGYKDQKKMVLVK